MKDILQIMRGIELKQLEKGTTFPVTIVMDRYNGSYSGAKWLAFQENNDDVPGEIGGGDPDEEYFWSNYNSNPKSKPIGKGNTPDEAYQNLIHLLKEYYK